MRWLIYLQLKSPWFALNMRLVVFQAGLDLIKKRRFYCTCQQWNNDFSIIQVFPQSHEICCTAKGKITKVYLFIKWMVRE
jgi:hypothetical protein